MGACIPRDHEPKIAACETQCRGQKGNKWESCIAGCVPKEVDAKVVACGEVCVPKVAAKVKALEEAAESKEAAAAAPEAGKAAS
jgi:hypothetical protein